MRFHDDPATRATLRAGNAPDRRWIPAATAYSSACHRLQTAGLAPGLAETTASALAYAANAGIASHGYELLPLYLQRIQAGGIRNAHPHVSRSNNHVRVEARGGPGPSAMRAAVEELSASVQPGSISVASVTENNHIGALGAYSQYVDWDRVDMIMVFGVASQQLVPPWASTPTLGSNAVSLMVRHGDDDPFVIDFGVAAMSLGRLRQLRTQDRPAPWPLLVDAAGNRTNSTRYVDSGGGVETFGGRRGALLALMVEIVAGAFGGNGSSRSVINQVTSPSECMNTSQTIIALGHDRTGAARDITAEILHTNFGDLAGPSIPLMPDIDAERHARLTESGELEVALSTQAWECLFAQEGNIC